MHRFDLDDASQIARDRIEAEQFQPTTLLEELLFWAVIAFGTVLFVILTMLAASALVGGW